MKEPDGRRKCWYRLRNILIAVVAATLLMMGAAAHFVVEWLFPKANVSVDYGAQLMRMAEEAQAEGESGWALFEEAARIEEEVRGVLLERARRGEGVSQQLSYNALFGDNPTEEDINVGRVALELMKERGVFDLTAKAAECPRFVRTLPTEEDRFLAWAVMEDRFRLTDLAGARRMALRSAIEEGDQTEILAAAGEMLAMAEAQSGCPTVIDFICALSIRDNLVEELSPAVASRQLTAETCDALLGIIDTADFSPDIEATLEGEHLVIKDTIQRIYTDDGNGDGRLIAREVNRLSTDGSDDGDSWQQLTMSVFCNRAETTVMIDTIVSRLQEEAQVPIQDFEADGIEAIVAGRLLGVKWALTEHLVSPLPKLFRLVVRDRFDLSGLRIMLALECHKASSGSYPTSHGELVPKYLSEVPPDVIVHADFVYRPITGPEGVQDYVLYSIGADGEDNGGQYMPMRPWATVVYPQLWSDYDYVFNRPRPELEVQ